MSDLTPVSATFSVRAGAYGEGHLDVTDLTPDQIAERIWDVVDASTSLCHQCADSIIDPEVSDMVSFTVGDVDYENVDGRWVVQS
jgi:hypothetical protein